MSDGFHQRLHHVVPTGLSGDTAQTPGMARIEAISATAVCSSALWMGEPHVSPATASADHHHGESETAIYVVSGHPRFVFLEDDGGTWRERGLLAAPRDYIF